MNSDQLLQKFGSKSRVFVKRHSATILTCVGAAGVVATTVAAVKATPKAMSLIEEARAAKGEELTKFEVVKAAGPVYIPSLLLGASTIACIFGANVLNKKNQAAITSAYVLLDNSYKEYKKKVEEIYGDDAHQNIITEIAKDRYVDEDLGDLEFDDNNKLFYDSYSEQYFLAKQEDVIKAEYETNKKIFTVGSANINDFYDTLREQGVDIQLHPDGDNLGWSTGILEAQYWATWLEFDHFNTEMEDGMECTIIAFRCDPMFDYPYY